MRRRTRDFFLSLALAAIASLLVGWTGPARAMAPASLAQDTPAEGGTPLGVPESGEAAWELIGRSDRDDRDITLVGYLTNVAGADPDLLYTEADRRSEATARFAVVAELSVAGTSTVDRVQSEATVGTLSVFFRADGEGDLADPASFMVGTPVAAFTLRTQDVRYGRAGATFFAASGEITQTSVEPFDHEGATYRLGATGNRLTLSLTGVQPSATAGPDGNAVLLAGRADLTGAAGPATPAAATPPPDEEATVPAGAVDPDACAAIAPWYATTSAQAAEIEVVAEFILDAAGTGDLGADQLRAAAEDLAVLAEQQRAVDVPAEAATTRDAIADAIDAVGIAVAAVAAAVEDGSEETLAAAQADLATALDDLLAAQADAEALAAPCDA